MADVQARRSARLQEPKPPIGTPIPEHPGVFRVVAPNPGPMTYHGTNTWLIELADPGGPLAVLDPGPDDDDHLAAVLAAGNGRIATILVSHAHGDHIALAPKLARALDLPIHAHPAIARVGIMADVAIGEGAEFGRVRALHTPGHALDHLCFAYDGSLFTADHVMGWSTSVVPPPPEGDAGHYIDSLTRLADRNDRRYFSGHGPVIDEPLSMVSTLIAQRQRREREILNLVRGGLTNADNLVGKLYPTLKPGLDGAARANMAGHLAYLGRQKLLEGIMLEAWQHDPIPPAF